MTTYTTASAHAPLRSFYDDAMSSTSNCSVAPGGITGGLPLSPYARSDGITSVALPPTLTDREG